MKFENGQWVVYESTIDSNNKETKTEIGSYTGNDPAAYFEKTLTSKNQQIMKWNEEHANDENTPVQQTFGNGSLNAVHYGSLSNNDESIVKLFGTNNIDQIVANSAIYARKA
jgi:hypothetical protein